MLCLSCRTWPGFPPTFLCRQCDTPPPPQIPVTVQPSEVLVLNTVQLRALRTIYAGEFVVLDRDVSDRHFPDIEQMMEDLRNEVSRCMGIPMDARHLLTLDNHA